MNEEDANVYCSFNESDSPDIGNTDSFWVITMRRQAGKLWLISGYGQGYEHPGPHNSLRCASHLWGASPGCLIG